jgi:hypothetical protein
VPGDWARSGRTLQPPAEKAQLNLELHLRSVALAFAVVGSSTAPLERPSVVRHSASGGWRTVLESSRRHLSEAGFSQWQALGSGSRRRARQWIRLLGMECGTGLAVLG